MPVWHELTKTWREEGRLALLGIAQEQHPERCGLFAEWKGFDWPILWDPFHLTASPAVPNVFALDEQGIVRAINPSPEWVRDEFLDREFPAPTGDSSSPPAWPVRPDEGALGRLLYAPDGPNLAGHLDQAIDELREVAHEHPGDGAAQFRLGVAYRMRFDSSRRQATDFQAALDAWGAALATDPNVYIWRRRIQQYGPRMDKPYPFYSWVAEAAAELESRGVPARPWTRQLSAAELAQPRRDFEPGTDPGQAPDERGQIHRAGDEFELATAVAWDSYGRAPLARVHLNLRPRPGSGAHWNNQAGPLQVWLGDPALPAGTSVEQRLLTYGGVPTDVVSDESRQLEFELRLPEGSSEPLPLVGYALFNSCSDVDGTCVYRRLDFELDLDPP